MDPHCFDADPEPVRTQLKILMRFQIQIRGGGGGGRSAKNVHPPWQNPRCAPVSHPWRVAGRAYPRERRGGAGIGTKSYDGEKAWSSMNHSILSDHEGKQRGFLFPFSSKYVFWQVAEITDILQGPNCPFLKDYASKGKPLAQCSGSVTFWTDRDPRIRTSD